MCHNGCQGLLSLLVYRLKQVRDTASVGVNFPREKWASRFKERTSLFLRVSPTWWGSWQLIHKNGPLKEFCKKKKGFQLFSNAEIE